MEDLDGLDDPLAREASIPPGVASLLAAMPPALRATASRRTVARGERLFASGRPPALLYLVLQGELRLVRTSRQGAETVLQRVREGPFAEASLDARAYHCDGVAGVASTLLAFPVAAVRTALEEAPAFRRAWMAGLAAEVRRLRAQCERLSLKGAGERILHYLATEGRDGEVCLPSTRKAWAAELGLTHEALYRALARLVLAGRLESRGRRLRLRPP